MTKRETGDYLASLAMTSISEIGCVEGLVTMEGTDHNVATSGAILGAYDGKHGACLRYVFPLEANIEIVVIARSIPLGMRRSNLRFPLYLFDYDGV